jgi:transcriptional regulator with XRE-family HTH domain
MPTIGETLREARMRQRLDIADVEAKTKIRAKYLRALENEEFSMLPGPTFVKTFLRTYAEALGLDPHVLVEEYRSAHEAGEEPEVLTPLGPPGSARDRRRGGGPRRPVGPLLVIGLGVLAVIGALLVIGLLSADDDGGEQQASEETETQPRRQRTERERERPPRRPRQVVLRITPATETYVCLDNGPGTEIRFEGIIDAPQTYRGKRLRVNLGNTSVEVTRNGRPFEIKPGTEPVGFVFTPRSSRQLPSGQRPCA